MKKLFLCCYFISMLTQAQDFWFEFATSQPTANTGVGSISIVDDNVTWLNMVCGTLGCSSIRRYSVTADGGLTWQTGEVNLGADSANLIIGNISGSSPLVAYAAAYPIMGASGGIWKTADAGNTWTRQPSAAFSDHASFPDLVHFWNENEGITLGDPTDGYFEIYITNNGGTVWSRIPSAPALIPIAIDEYLFINNFTVTGNTIWTLTNYGRILKSMDKGLHWTISQSPITEFNIDIGFTITVSMAFTDQNNGLLQTNDARIFSTNDGGATWSAVNYVGVARSADIAAIPGIPNAYIAVGDDYLNVVRGSSYSIDSGLHWIDINDNPDSNYVNGNTIAMLNPRTGFAGGFSISAAVGGIFKWGDSNCYCSTKTDFSSNLKVLLSPNPTSGKVTLSGTNMQQFTVSDLSGKQIISSQFSPIDHKTIDLETLDNGLYLLTILSEQGTATVKIVKQ